MTDDSFHGETIGAATRHVARGLAAAGIDEATSEARWLVAAALGLSAADLVSRSAEPLSQLHAQAISKFLARRVQHEPLSRIAGERSFYGRTFEVTPATLDPRTETETLIDAALEMLGPAATGRPVRILDIGTGTGCILVTLLCELPCATGVATDISPHALAVAARNAQRHGVADRVVLQVADLGEGIAGPFDLVVSNPPYIRSGDIAGLSRAVREYDPHLALDGGSDGLAVYRRILVSVPRLGAGLLLFEAGHDQAEDLTEIIRSTLFRDTLAELRIFHDVAGIPRVVAARTRIAADTEKGLGFSKSAE